MTNSSLSWPSRPTSEPSLDAAFGDAPAIGARSSCRRRVSTGCCGRASICSAVRLEREQFLPGSFDFDAGILEGGPRPQKIVFAENLALEQPG